MSWDTAIVSAMAAVVQLVVGLVLAMGAVYIGLKLFDRLTKGLREWEEIKNGNVAVGIFIAAVIISISFVIQSSVASLLAGLDTATDPAGLAVVLGLGLLNLAIGIIAGVGSVYLAIKIFDRITVDIDEMKELEKGNVAIAIILAGVLLAVSFIIASAVTGITSALSPENLGLV
ncbi:DUF350 domain-containing protein [Methanomassiliicoccus luminyensis]|uniref:DUF350 domain-containing protein n=1 Tax=Methanomassiliicoccus luminyensis TaxID=1080712 RepID=UPI00047516BC|nr:DUF350 domain-containing protein [Methanomassiliicoccus luminyensis]